MWYKGNPIKLPPGVDPPNEVIFEVITAPDNYGFGLAVADIKESQKHYHKKTLETYTLIAGNLKVHLGETVRVLSIPGETLIIPINTPHWGESTGDTPARIVVFTIPAWTPEDHLLL